MPKTPAKQTPGKASARKSAKISAPNPVEPVAAPNGQAWYILYARELVAVGIALTAPRDLWITNRVQAAIVSLSVAVAFAWFYQPVAQAKHVLDQMEAQRQSYQAKVDSLSHELQARDTELAQLRTQVDGDGGQVADLQQQLAYHQQISDKKLDLFKKTAEKLIKSKDTKIHEQETEIMELNSQLKAMQSKLQEQQREIQNLRNSLTKTESSSRQHAAVVNTQQVIQSAVASVQGVTAQRRGSIVQEHGQAAGASAMTMAQARAGTGASHGPAAAQRGPSTGGPGRQPMSMAAEELDTSDMTMTQRRRSPARAARMAIPASEAMSLQQGAGAQGKPAQLFVPQPRSASAGPAPVARPPAAKSVVAAGIHQFQAEEDDQLDSYAGVPYGAGRAGAGSAGQLGMVQAPAAGPAGGNKKRGYPQYAVFSGTSASGMPLQQLPNAVNAAGGTGLGKTQQLAAGAGTAVGGMAAKRASPGRMYRAQNV